MEIRAVGNCLSRVLVGGSLVVAGAGCAAGGEAQAVAAGTDGAEWRGSVVSVTPVVRMSRTDVPRYLEKEDPRLGSPQASRGINGFRVLYRTISPSGRPIVASGVVALPRDGAKVLRAVSFTHGTQVWRDTAGSVAADGQGRIAAIYYAAAGYAGVAPDYLGLGMGEGKHPYMDAASEASASLDMLRAARTVAGRQGRRLERRVLVTGYSQGGHAAMALGRQLQQGADPYLRLGALAPVSGPYDTHVQIPASLDGSLDSRTSAFYLAYATVAWNRLHRIYKKPSEVFQAPYDTFLEGLFDGSHDEQEIVPQLPASPEQLLTSRYLTRLRQPSGGLLRAFQAVDGTCDWAPRAPVRLYGATGDEQVSFANTRSCARTLHKHGKRPQVVDYGTNVHHFDTLYRALPDTLRWFQKAA
ncbi:hypothetical protein LUW74_31635 [Actinomadura madurae]|uniref:lipase family protein n=1 Tax=Actinomadura madurae TaxID=1993 RepID=UPI0020276A0A|nr:lipase family protein [Actinomadura madurae]URN07451.1 hypothetical protein LUW74_31635 [Actinomadura madurae]